MAKKHFEFNSEERTLLVFAYGRTFSVKLRELRVISASEEEAEDDDDPVHAVCGMFYREHLENDIQATCWETLDIVENHLLPFTRDAENTALYTKMKADTYWILAMPKKEEHKELLVNRALTAYNAASKEAEMLSAAHPLRLEVILTKTAFYFDVMKWTELATDLAKLALDKAGPELDSLDEESYKKSSVIMGLIKDNLKLWKPTSPKTQDYSDSSENNNISLNLGSLSLEAGPSNSNGGSPSPPPPPVVPCSADYYEDENNTFFEVASLEIGHSNSNAGSPSPPPPPVVPRSADYYVDENNASFEASSLEGSASPPPPVVARPAGPPVAPSEFRYPGDWGYQFHDALSQREIRLRKKAAQIKKGRLG